MAQNWLRITHQNDKVQLSWQRGYESPRFASEVAFQQPFDEKNAAELRWYLEDYLCFPYGIFPDNAVKIEQKLQYWGQHLFELCLSIACDRTERTTLKSDRISFCQKVVMLRLNLMMLVINVVTLSLKVIALSLKVIRLSLNVTALSLKVTALSLNVIALRFNVVMLVTTRHSFITAIVDSGTILQPVPSFESQPDKPKRQTKIKALQGWFEKTQPTPSDFDPDQARWEALKEKHNL